MKNNNVNCILFWGQGRFRKTIPHNQESNIPIMHMVALALAYRAFAATFEAMQANFFLQEHILQPAQM